MENHAAHAPIEAAKDAQQTAPPLALQKESSATIAFGEAFRALHEASFTLLVVLLCVPFIQPISLGPLATVGGLSLAALGWQMARGRATPWLPERLERMQISVATWNKLLSLSNKVLGLARRFSRPRLQALASPRGSPALIGYTVCAAGLLMAVPFVGVPLNNTFPALMAICAAVAALERDGLLVIASFFWLVITIAYFALVIWALIYLGSEAVMPFVQSFF